MFYSSVDELEKDIAGVVDFALYQVQSAHTLLAHADLFPIVGSNSALTDVHTLIQTGSIDLQACSSELNTSCGEEVQCRGRHTRSASSHVFARFMTETAASAN